MASERRFFLAHAKSDDDARIAGLLALARIGIEIAARDRPYSITTGRDFFASEFKRCGSWAAWATEVAMGVDFASREPRFHAIFVPAGRVGAGTAAIIEKALSASKPVFAFDEHGTLTRVIGVSCVDRGDWQTGYELRRR